MICYSSVQEIQVLKIRMRIRLQTMRRAGELQALYEQALLER
jgi:hypothetical protein